MRTLSYTIPPERDGQTVKTVLLGEFRFSGALFRSLRWREGAICLDGSPVRTGAAVRAGETLTVALAERRTPSAAVTPCALPLDVVYEDDDLLVLNKPAGVPMHAADGPTMAGALRAYLGLDAAAHFVNRLDSGTSGLLIAAKSGYIHDRFRAALHTGALYREYRAVAVGAVTPSGGVITLPLGRAEGAERRYCPRPDGRPARTEYETISQSGGLTFLRLVPRTGRTHQLRVHMSAIGFPLAGDRLYGAPAGGIERPALHSAVLRFTHPLTGEAFRFAAPLPTDMANLLRR